MEREGGGAVRQGQQRDLYKHDTMQKQQEKPIVIVTKTTENERYCM